MKGGNFSHKFSTFNQTICYGYSNESSFDIVIFKFVVRYKHTFKVNLMVIFGRLSQQSVGLLSNALNNIYMITKP